MVTFVSFDSLVEYMCSIKQNESSEIRQKEYQRYVFLVIIMSIFY